MTSAFHFCALVFYLFIKTELDCCLSKRQETMPSIPDIQMGKANKIVLVEPDVYIMYWAHSNTDITFEIHVKTDGWSSFGLSRHGDMQYSDVVVTWVNANGSFHFTDRHIFDEKVKPKVDQEQNWFPLSIKREAGYLKAKFTRKILVNSKSNEDLDVATGSPFVVFAWGKIPPADDITYHGPENRGQMGVSLLKIKSIPLANPNVVKTLDLLVDATLIDGYYCRLFQHSNEFLEQKKEILKFEAQITPGNEEYIHHVGLNECSIEFETEYLEKNREPDPGACYPLDSSKTAWNEVIKYCRTFSLMWSDYNITKIQDVSNEIMPDLFENLNQRSKYFFVYVHHFNPSLHKKVDKSGFRIYYKN